MKEIWKDINGFEGVYQISNLGRVKRLPVCIMRKNGVRATYKTKIYKIGKNIHGYYFIQLRHNGKTEIKQIHRLIAEHFIANPHNLKYVNHKNGIKGDNRICNLEWVSPSENILHSIYELGNESGKERRMVMCKETGKIYASVNSAAREVGALSSSISRAANGKRKTAIGMHWVFV